MKTWFNGRARFFVSHSHDYGIVLSHEWSPGEYEGSNCYGPWSLDIALHTWRLYIGGIDKQIVG